MPRTGISFRLEFSNSSTSIKNLSSDCLHFGSEETTSPPPVRTKASKWKSSIASEQILDYLGKERVIG